MRGEGGELRRAALARAGAVLTHTQREVTAYRRANNDRPWRPQSTYRGDPVSLRAEMLVCGGAETPLVNGDGIWSRRTETPVSGDALRAITEE